MRAAAVPFVALLLAGCARPESWAPTEPPDVFRHWADRMKERFPELQTIFGPSCIWRGVPTDQCFRMEEPRRWRGLWRNTYEHPVFCPTTPSNHCGDRVSGPWWTILIDRPRARPYQLYEIDFVGRLTVDRISYGPTDHEHQILVDRVIAIREVAE